jgi:hypothetical protein
MLTRIACTTLLILAVFLFPWWLVLVFLMASLFYFSRFYEAIGVGLLLDSVYATGSVAVWFPYMLTCSTIVLVVCVQFIRARLIMY